MSYLVIVKKTFRWCALLIGVAIAGCGGGGGTGPSPPQPNDPPVVSNVTIAPATPRVTDDLTGNASVSDPNGDSTTVSYRWTRNGTPIVGQTNRTLPRGQFNKSDVIELFVTASDGRDEATSSARTTIQDSPVQISASPPTQVTYGEVFTFDIAVSDPDGDPIAFLLLHGPAGMQVSPNGRVTWTARLPMFDRMLDVHWAIGSTSSATPLVSGTVRVEDPARRYPLHRTVNGAPSRRELIVADLNGDSRLEMLVSGQTLHELGYESGSFVQRWAYPFDFEGVQASPASNAVASIAVADSDRDGRMEIFAALKTGVMKLDGVTRRRIEEFAVIDRCIDLSVADLNDDASLQLVCLAIDASGHKQIRLFHAGTGALIAEAPVVDATAAFAVANVDADAAREIITSEGAVIDSQGLTVEWSSGVHFGPDLTVGDIDGDGRAEIIGIVGGVVQAFDAVDRTLQWTIVTITAAEKASAVMAADLNNDGRAEVIVNDAAQTSGYRYNTTTQQTERAFTLPDPSSRDHAYAVGDLDVDGDLDLVRSNLYQNGSGQTASEMIVASLGATPTRIWDNSSNELSNVTGGYWAELTPGQRRLVFGARGIVLLDPVSERYVWHAFLDNPATAARAITVTDMDDDGADDALIASPSGAERFDPATESFAAFPDPLGRAVPAATSMTHTDLYADGIDDIIGNVSGADIAAADLLNRDGKEETVSAGHNALAGRSYFHLFGNSQEFLVNGDFRQLGFNPTNARSADVLIADASGDSVPEVYILLDQTPVPGALIEFSPDLHWTAKFDAPDARQVFLEDLGSGRKNLILASFTADGRSTLRAIDRKSGALIWESPALNGIVNLNSLHYVDTNADEEPELSFGTTNGLYLTR
jgi:FG-GAP-like repeat